MTRLSCRVATRALSLRFCRKNFNSGDFFLAIFSPVASQVRGWLHALAARQNLKKSHHLREQEIARVAAALIFIIHQLWD